MKRVTIGWVSITQGEVDSDAKLNFTPTKNVLEESVALVEVEVLEAYALITATPNNVVLHCTFPQLSNVAAEVAKVDMLATLLGLEELKSYLSLWVLICQLRGQNCYEVPRVAPI